MHTLGAWGSLGEALSSVCPNSRLKNVAWCMHAHAHTRRCHFDQRPGCVRRQNRGFEHPAFTSGVSTTCQPGIPTQGYGFCRQNRGSEHPAFSSCVFRACQPGISTKGLGVCRQNRCSERAFRPKAWVSAGRTGALSGCCGPTLRRLQNQNLSRLNRNCATPT